MKPLSFEEIPVGYGVPDSFFGVSWRKENFLTTIYIHISSPFKSIGYSHLKGKDTEMRRCLLFSCSFRVGLVLCRDKEQPDATTRLDWVERA